MDDGTRLFLGALADLGDDDLDRPLALPGWTGRHVVAHVHYNARALGRLVRWLVAHVNGRAGYLQVKLLALLVLPWPL